MSDDETGQAVDGKVPVYASALVFLGVWGLVLAALNMFSMAHPTYHVSWGGLLTFEATNAAFGDAKDGFHFEVLGDTIRVGRRGSLNGTLTVKGQQGHVAYPETVINPIHLAAIAIEKLLATPLDQGHGAFPPSTLQVTNIHAGTGATNVVPGDCCVEFNFRFNTAWNASSLKDWTETRLDAVLDKYDLQWTLSGDPFLTNEGELLSVVDDAIQSVCGITPIHSTGGGTSDGRFLAPHDIDVVEVGVTNGTIHKVDERVAVSELRGLCDIYYQIMQTLLAPK